MNPMKLRFAPSPTGYLHVGGARTAIFNLLHARRHGGSLVLRIEDTDVERSRQHHAEQIMSSLRWLGVEWDEGPVYQSDRLDRYRQRVDQLLEKGAAYRCFCTVEELDAARTEAEREGRQFRYSGKCRDLPAPPPGQPFVVRFRVEEGAVEFHDLIRGDVRFGSEVLDDFVLLRSDGNPTYHLSVVVDDIDMGITLVARGDDHLSNTPKHVLLFRAFDAPIPEFAHLPLILGRDRKRLSKRTGSTSVEEFQDRGFLPEALFNFLTLLGFAPGEDREILTREEATALFDLSEVNKAAAVFDEEKLLWLNGHYLRAMTPGEIRPYLEPFLEFEVQEPDRLDEAIRLHQPRARTLREMAEQMAPYFQPDELLVYEPEAVRKHLRGEDLAERLESLRDLFSRLDPFTIESTEEALRELAEGSGRSAGKYIHPLRIALTGRGASPGIFEIVVLVGRERVVGRLRRLIEALPNLVDPPAD